MGQGNSLVPADRLIGPTAAAARLGVCARTVVNLVDRGALRGWLIPQVGRIIDARDVERLATERAASHADAADN